MVDEKIFKIDTRVERCQVDLDYIVNVFNVNLETSESTWSESMATEAEVKAFLRGVEAGCVLNGQPFMRPQIPEDVTKRFVEVVVDVSDDDVPF